MESMLVSASVGLAALYLVRRVWRTLRSAGDEACGCDAGAAGCPAASELARDLKDAIRP